MLDAAPECEASHLVKLEENYFAIYIQFKEKDLYPFLDSWSI